MTGARLEWERLSNRGAQQREAMKGIAFKSALLALAVSIAPAIAGEQGAVVRNCTWCHGTSAQGYTIAPRLAGQRPLYIEGQIRSFREHIRDNPYSRQYMWGERSPPSLPRNELGRVPAN